MGARTSPEVIEAIRLIKTGISAYAAAKTVGIALSTIYRSRLYKKMQAQSVKISVIGEFIG